MFEKTGNVQITERELSLLLALKKNKVRVTAGAVLFACFYIFAQYTLPLMSYGLVALCLYAAVRIAFGGHILINKSLFLVCAVAVVQQMAVYIITGTFRQNLNTYLFMFVCLVLLSALSQIDADSFYVCYEAVGIFVSIVLICQAIPLLLGRMDTVSAIRILPVAPEDIPYWSIGKDRPSGLFTEPQAYASFLHPLLVMSLFRKKKALPVFLTVGILISGSSQGIIIAAFIWGYYLFLVERKPGIRIVALCLSAIVIVIGLQTDLIRGAFQKIFEIGVNIQQRQGYDIRLTKGFEIYAAMPFRDKLLGIGFGNLESYLRHGNFHFWWMTKTKDRMFAYITTMSNVFVSCGIAGALAYVLLFIREISQSRREAKLLACVLLIASFAQTMLFNAWFVFYWSIYQIIDDRNSNRYYRLALQL